MLTFLCLAHMLDAMGCMPREEDRVMSCVIRLNLQSR